MFIGSGLVRVKEEVVSVWGVKGKQGGRRKWFSGLVVKGKSGIGRKRVSGEWKLGRAE